MEVWNTRTEVNWEQGIVKVVSKDGLKTLKSLRGSGQDIDDIKNLEELEDEN